MAPPSASVAIDRGQALTAFSRCALFDIVPTDAPPYNTTPETGLGLVRSRMVIQRPNIPWAKLVRSEPNDLIVGWHSLVDHSADVAAAFEAIINVRCVAARLACLAGLNQLPDVWRPRLATLVALHDFGKANRGFQARWDLRARPIGHTREALVLLCDPLHAKTLFQVLGLHAIEDWGGWPQNLLAVLAHHGRPLDPSTIRPDDGGLWGEPNDDAPVRSLTGLGEAVKRWFPEAFIAGGTPLPDAPPFWHAIAGFAMLADWLGSDTDFFAFANGSNLDRMTHARACAARALQTIGFDSAPARKTLRATPSFTWVSEHPARPIQLETGEAPGNIIVLESETGSGKTEAALYRFARLFAAGKVDGLYFALPTRVAATSIYNRVRQARDRIFPDPAQRPGVVLAVPGYLRFDGVEGHPLPDFGVQWSDNADGAESAARWASVRPKRFLAGTIAVGTIDQALMGAIKVTHAHLRAASLLRHLLVVDEVHASDRYMEHLLTRLVQFHRSAGGQALLLSATLGSAARSRLLAGIRADPLSFADAIAAPYPALSSDIAPCPAKQRANGQNKTVALTLTSEIAEPASIAARALRAAEKGAKVLVVRNTRNDAVRTFQALAELATNHDALFRCAGVATLHHGRFAQEDRTLLDAAVETSIGRDRRAGGLILIGTQTLEQSLDIDADVLITDLCPADVLLQRLGRLHRHGWRKGRPEGFETPHAIILAPDRMEALLKRGRHGLGGTNGPYDDLLAVEATRRFILRQSVWSIPDMNRLIVETATHPESQAVLMTELITIDRDWEKVGAGREGRLFALAQQAANARLRTDISWTAPDVVFPKDEIVSTRLGLRDLAIVFDGAGPTGPFGNRVKHLAIPDFWLKGGDRADIDPSGDVTPRNVLERRGGFTFVLQERAFAYTETGLTPTTSQAMRR